MKSFFKIADLFIILFTAIFICFAFYSVYIKENKKPQVLIRGQGGEWTFPVDAEETVNVTGVLGDTVIRLHENRAWVESSPCDNQTCVASGFIYRQGQWAACLPNNVLLMIQGEKENEIDSAAW